MTAGLGEVDGAPGGAGQGSPRRARVLRAVLRGLALLALLAGLLVLVPATAFTVTRLRGPEAGPLVAVVSFTPFGLALHLIALLLLIPAALGRGRRRWLARLSAAVALVGVGLHAWWLAPSFVGDTPVPTSGGEALTVMTTNVYEGRGSAEEIAAAVRRDRVDILVVNEARPLLLTQADEAGLSTLLPYRSEVGSWWQNSSTTVVLSRFPVGEKVRVPTRDTSILVTVQAPDGPLTVLAAHPESPDDPEGWRTDHRVLRESVDQARPDFVVGDLNATLDHRPIQALESDGYRDSAELADSGWAPTWPALGIGPPVLPRPVVAIDHVLLGPGWTASATRAETISGTDHLALLAGIAATDER